MLITDINYIHHLPQATALPKDDAISSPGKPWEE